MDNSTLKNLTKNQLSFMGFATPNPQDSQNDISKRISEKWNNVEKILCKFGDQLEINLKVIPPKVIFDFKYLWAKTINIRTREQIKIHQNESWEWYRNWKKSFNGNQGWNIPDFVYIVN